LGLASIKVSHQMIKGRLDDKSESRSTKAVAACGVGQMVPE